MEESDGMMAREVVTVIEVYFCLTWYQLTGLSAFVVVVVELIF